eukprot:CAMPEP_0197073206 /NCGR_PEP_ID=MMETSP1384-20130603/210491_1 /TAXON_ID=29189 /ORGANISM="Ammonia sp." /LENGTH=146 /DNA_ID=CAMNT_0042512039 /DNA_START=94 /DNA_END=534 /DNA_ORIENTATION=+
MAGNLSKFEVAQFKEAFALFDTNKDGTLEPDELKFVMSALGQECTDDEIKDIIDVADELGTGRIDFPSFLKQFQHAEKEDPMEMLDEAFALIGHGQDITEDAVKTFLSTLGQNIIDVEAQEIIKVLDKDGDGKVNLEDFKDIWTKK